MRQYNQQVPTYLFIYIYIYDTTAVGGIAAAVVVHLKRESFYDTHNLILCIPIYYTTVQISRFVPRCD